MIMSRLPSKIRKGAKALVRNIANKFGVTIVKSSEADRIESGALAVFDLNFLRHMPLDQCHDLINLLDESKSQLRQDLFVLSRLGFRRGGFFVEFGATNGVSLSISWLLEQKFDIDHIGDLRALARIFAPAAAVLQGVLSIEQTHHFAPNHPLCFVRLAAQLPPPRLRCAA